MPKKLTHLQKPHKKRFTNGNHRSEKVRIGIIDYDEKHAEEKEVTRIEHCLPFRDTPTVTWMDIDERPCQKDMEMLGICFKVHPLVLEDIANADQRPKTEDYEENIYIALQMLSYNEERKELEAEQVNIVIGNNFVISIQEGTEGDVFDPIRKNIRDNKGFIRKMGTDYLGYTLIDIVVDQYFTVLEKLGERIEYLEERLVRNPTPETLQILHKMKRDLIFLRKTVWPLREAIHNLERCESKLIKKTTRLYLRDVYDHAVRIIDFVETFRDIVSGMLDIYLSSVSNRLNSVMKMLTVITTIFMPLTFIAGIYGMNFVYMPELEHPLGYPLILFIMFIIGLSMFLFFKKKKWI